MLGMVCPRLPSQEGCSLASMGAHQQRAAASIEVTGQSEKPKLHAVGEHRPGSARLLNEPLGSVLQRINLRLICTV
jgi:hypothetical protein